MGGVGAQLPFIIVYEQYRGEWIQVEVNGLVGGDKSGGEVGGITERGRFQNHTSGGYLNLVVTIGIGLDKGQWCVQGGKTGVGDGDGGAAAS